ncbi:hypothetical protein VB776_08000 [Arcicella sp. DC2W]|uniref:Uncharacterized protein n=1 Tax=Arcicella gelida TaxID=2984195 RepID=A0ABU5S2Y9_9BACT|nr:hypothetical protein [Arcicella sp. DC2W]MEA5402853.1 hypothetical protein [Arcicella sp. DC2W]
MKWDKTASDSWIKIFVEAYGKGIWEMGYLVIQTSIYILHTVEFARTRNAPTKEAIEN